MDTKILTHSPIHRDVKLNFSMKIENTRKKQVKFFIF